MDETNKGVIPIAWIRRMAETHSGKIAEVIRFLLDRYDQYCMVCDAIDHKRDASGYIRMDKSPTETENFFRNA